jgi:hypothetical protein
MTDKPLQRMTDTRWVEIADLREHILSQPRNTAWNSYDEDLWWGLKAERGITRQHSGTIDRLRATILKLQDGKSETEEPIQAAREARLRAWWPGLAVGLGLSLVAVVILVVTWLVRGFGG